MTTGEVLHIHCHAEPDQRQHTLTGGCWCHPYTLRCVDGTVVVDHNGLVRPGVTSHPQPAHPATYVLPRLPMPLVGNCIECDAPITAKARRCGSCARRQAWRTRHATTP